MEKKSLITFIIREMQIKAILRYPLPTYQIGRGSKDGWCPVLVVGGGVVAPTPIWRESKSASYIWMMAKSIQIKTGHVLWHKYSMLRDLPWKHTNTHCIDLWKYPQFGQRLIWVEKRRVIEWTYCVKKNTVTSYQNSILHLSTLTHRIYLEGFQNLSYCWSVKWK